jgi:cytochrome P450
VEHDPHLANAGILDGPEIFYSPLVLSAMRSGAWVVTRNHLIREVLQDADTFSSKHIAGFSTLLGETWDLIPLEIDGADHAMYRALLNPLFSPQRIDELESGIRQSCAELIDCCLARGECDFEEDFGHRFPVYVFLRLMGLPLELMPRFLEWETGLLQGKDFERAMVAAREVKNYLVGMIAERRRQPLGDLISFVVTAKVQDRLLTDDEALGTCYLLFVAGLDSVAGTLGFMFRYLAEHPEQQRLLRREPGLIVDAMEEMLRAFAIVTSNRFVTRDIDFHGVQMKAGDRIMLPMPVAARDELEYERPNEINFRRENLRHLTFSAGPHRCIGSHLARREIRIALEEWLKRVPEFHIPAGKTPIVRTAAVLGMTSLPLTW